MDKRVVDNPELYAAARAGLTAQPKTLDPKWFYDAAGSALFEQITKLPEYYPTKTELSILRSQTDAIAAHVPSGAALVELGSGASIKTRVLLNRLTQLGAYVPLDISAVFLAQTTTNLRTAYPDLEITPVVADFLRTVTLPRHLADTPKTAYFPGSTLGNLTPTAAVDLLARIHDWGNVRSFILGVDLVKDRETLIRAYDDSAGVTAAFNRNVLHRLNREVGATFDVDQFAHEARWNAPRARIEMHLVSQTAQTVELGPTPVHFTAGESIHTENSHKYTPESITRIATSAGWRVAEILTDPQDWFAVCILEPTGR